MNNLYKILNIDNSATPDQIKKSYFDLAKKYHPDSADESEVHKFYEVAEAYQVLSDPEERRAYDLTLEGGKIEKVLVEEPPVHPTIFKEEKPKDEEFRKKEMFRFRRRIFLRGILRVIGFTVFLAVIGYVLSFVLGGHLSIGWVAGLAVGLVWGINRNFDVASFVKSKNKRLITKIIGWILLASGVGYFGWLLVDKFV